MVDKELKKKEVAKLKEDIFVILKDKKVKRAGLFGSYARGEQKKDSDVDILIEFDGSLLDLVRVEREIKKKLKKKVDLITYNGLSPYLKERILNEEVRIM